MKPHECFDYFYPERYGDHDDGDGDDDRRPCVAYLATDVGGSKGVGWWDGVCKIW